MRKAEDRTVITVGSGGSVVELIFSTSGLGRTTIADKRSSQKPCACVGNKIRAERLGDITFMVMFWSRHFSINTLLSRVKCFWLPGIKLDIIYSFLGTGTIREHYKLKWNSCTTKFHLGKSVISY